MAATLDTGNDILTPRRPTGGGWQDCGDIRVQMRSAYPVSMWWHEEHQLKVFSAVEVAYDGPGSIEKGPEYHLSMSKALPTGEPSRCSLAEAMWVLAQFGLDGWEEDNHVPNGVVRNFWRPIAENLVGIECECKETETLVVEGDYEHRPLPLV